MSDVTIEREGRVAIVRFDRGSRANPLSLALMRELTAAARSFEHDAEINAVILTGRGSDADTAALLPDLPDMLQGRTTRARVFTAPSRAGRTLTYTLVPVPGTPLP